MAPSSKQAGTSSSTSKKQAGGRLLSAADLFSGGSKKFKRIELPEIEVDGEPGYVFYKPLTSRMVVDFIASGRDDNGKEDPELQNLAMLRIIAQTVCDEQGNLIFDGADDVEQMRDIRMKVFNKLAQAIMSEIAEAASVGKDASPPAARNASTGASSSV